MRLLKRMRIEWIKEGVLDSYTWNTLGFVVCTPQYDIQSVYNMSLAGANIKEFWDNEDYVVMCYPAGHKNIAEFVTVALISAPFPRTVDQVPTMKVGRFYLRNLGKADPKFAEAAKVATVLSKTLNVQQSEELYTIHSSVKKNYHYKGTGASWNDYPANTWEAKVQYRKVGR